MPHTNTVNTLPTRPLSGNGISMSGSPVIRSSSTSQIRRAVAELTAKLTPSGSTVAPSGSGRPADTSSSTCLGSSTDANGQRPAAPGQLYRHRAGVEGIVRLVVDEDLVQGDPAGGEQVRRDSQSSVREFSVRLRPIPELARLARTLK